MGHIRYYCGKPQKSYDSELMDPDGTSISM